PLHCSDDCRCRRGEPCQLPGNGEYVDARTKDRPAGVDLERLLADRIWDTDLHWWSYMGNSRPCPKARGRGPSHCRPRSQSRSPSPDDGRTKVERGGRPRARLRSNGYTLWRRGAGTRRLRLCKPGKPWERDGSSADD